MRERSDEGGMGGREEPGAQEERPTWDSPVGEDSMDPQRDDVGVVEEEDPTERPIKVRRTGQESF